MKSIKQFIVAVLISAVLASCSKSGGSGNNPPPGDTTKAISGVYAAGYEYNGQRGQAKVWKNDKLLYTLSDPLNDAIAYSVAVSGSDVYAAGFETKTGGQSYQAAKVWKNGKELYNFATNENGSVAVAVAIHGSDVYAAGYEMVLGGNTVKVWKNGQVLYTLVDAASAVAHGMAVDDAGNIYVVGYLVDKGTAIGRLWKNGALLYSFTTYPHMSEAYAVAVQGSDVWSVWFDYQNSTTGVKLSKNDALIYNLSNIYNSGGFGIAVQGGSTYVAGYTHDGNSNGVATDIARVWKDGVTSGLTDGTQDASAFAVGVAGSDVYAGGMENNGSYRVAKVWKNGKPLYTLTDGKNDAYVKAIAVAP